MVGFFETISYWQGGFTEEQKYYEEHRLSQKGKHLCEQINKLHIIARNVCSTYNVTYCHGCQYSDTYRSILQFYDTTTANRYVS
jgi:hypothetical protein